MFVFLEIISDWVIVKRQLVIFFNLFDSIDSQYVFSFWNHDLYSTVGITWMIQTPAKVTDILRIDCKTFWLDSLIKVTLNSYTVKLDLIALIFDFFIMFRRNDLFFFLSPRTKQFPYKLPNKLSFGNGLSNI